MSNLSFMIIEYDDHKNVFNIRKHSISFITASSVLDDPKAVIIYDELHSTIEDRYNLLGAVDNHILFIVYTMRDNVIRIINVMVENRRVNGKVKQYTLETIGTWDKVLERFSSYWNKENSQSVTANFEAFIHGAPYALYRIAQQLGIEEILVQSLPERQRNGIKRSTSLILAAIHRACDPGSKNAFSAWFKKTSLPKKPEFSLHSNR